MKKLKPYLLLLRSSLKNKILNFSGRASRAEYAIVIFGLIIAQLTVFSVVASISVTIQISGIIEYNNIVKAILYTISIPLLLIITLGFFAIKARRLHDLNFSGWWQILFMCNPSPLIFSDEIIVFSLCIAPYLIFLCKKGTPQTNRFGEVPGI